MGISLLRHYKQGYVHVLEIVTHDTNLLEVKTIAGFINYKVFKAILLIEISCQCNGMSIGQMTVTFASCHRCVVCHLITTRP